MMPAVTVSRNWFGEQESGQALLSRRWFGGQDAGAWSRTFDAVEVEDHTFETTVTDEPVETGSSIADHAYDLPVRLTITAAVSDIPPPGKDGDTYATQGPTRGLAAYAWLRQAQQAHDPFSVQSGLDLFPSMLITSLKVKKDKSLEHILYFTVELKEIKWVTAQVVLYPAHPKVQRNSAPKKDDGEKGSDEPDAATKVKARSLLKKMGASRLAGIGS